MNIIYLASQSTAIYHKSSTDDKAHQIEYQYNTTDKKHYQTKQKQIEKFPHVTGSIALQFSDTIEKVLENAENLSGGERQKVLLARIFMQNPDVIILDESFNAIDEETGELTDHTHGLLTYEQATTPSVYKKITSPSFN